MIVIVFELIILFVQVSVIIVDSKHVFIEFLVVSATLLVVSKGAAQEKK